MWSANLALLVLLILAVASSRQTLASRIESLVAVSASHRLPLGMHGLKFRSLICLQCCTDPAACPDGRPAERSVVKKERPDGRCRPHEYSQALPSIVRLTVRRPP